MQELLNNAIAECYRTDAVDKKTTAIDYAGELQFLQATGVGGLNNGLSADEILQIALYGVAIVREVDHLRCVCNRWSNPEVRVIQGPRGYDIPWIAGNHRAE